MGKYEHIVNTDEVGMTINQILRANFTFSRRFKTKIKFQELIDLNGVKSKGFIKPNLGDLISVRLPIEDNNFPPEDIPIDIVYEDSDLLIINKQAGITVHPTKGHPNNTLANGITSYIEKTNQNFKIRFCNRLDMDTSGLIIVAKNSNIQNEISKQMQKDLVVKKYIALVYGIIEKDNFIIDLPVGRPDPSSPKRSVLSIDKGGKNAVTGVEVIKRFYNKKLPEPFDGATLVNLTLYTGRTHQIRIHLSHINHPIIGDGLYSNIKDEKMTRQALHARYIKFKHPTSGEEMELNAEIPSDINLLIKRLSSLI